MTKNMRLTWRMILKKRLLSFLLILFLSSTAYAAFEDFTTFTEVDEQDDITITDEVTITVSSMRRDADSYVYKDYGADHFGDFSHSVKSVISANTAGMFSFWGAANTIDDFDGLDATEDGIASYHNELITSTEIITIEDLVNDSTDSTGDINLGTWYMTISRSGTTLTNEIYSDEAKTTLVDTIAVTCGTTTFRYLYAVIGKGSGVSASNATGTVEDLDLNEAIFTPRIINYN